MWGKVSESCDVYSFGILLLEILTGRKPIEKLTGGVKRTITEWAEPLTTKDKFKDLDPKLGGNFDESQLKQSINVAAMCVQSEPDKRPTMKQVAEMLKGNDAKRVKMRVKSVKYREDLLARDGVYDESSAYGVFGAMDVQMQDPYRRINGDWRGKNN